MPSTPPLAHSPLGRRLLLAGIFRRDFLAFGSADPLAPRRPNNARGRPGSPRPDRSESATDENTRTSPLLACEIIGEKESFPELRPIEQALEALAQKKFEGKSGEHFRPFRT